MEGKLVKIIEINILLISVYIIIIMNATRILNMFKQTSLTHIKAPLGRWNIHNHRETTLKIKYANEDNCGISGNNYKNTTLIQENVDFDDNQYIYSMGYESVHN
jgi:hypothetical protein